MKIAHPKLSDISSLKHIWQVCFGDEEEYIDAFFENIFSPNICLALYENNQPVSALYMLPAQLISGEKSYKCSYIYALGTLPGHRLKGYGKELLNFACRESAEKGYDFTFLVPSEKNLFKFYEKLNFTPAFYLEEKSYNPKPVNIFSFEKISFSHYYLLRNKYLKNKAPYIDWGESSIEIFDLFAKKFGGDILKFNGGAAFCYPYDQYVLVKEILYDDNLSMEDILSSLAYFYGRDKIILRTLTNNTERPVAAAFFNKNIEMGKHPFLPYISLFGD